MHANVSMRLGSFYPQNCSKLIFTDNIDDKPLESGTSLSDKPLAFPQECYCTIPGSEDTGVREERIGCWSLPGALEHRPVLDHSSRESHQILTRNWPSSGNYITMGNGPFTGYIYNL